MPKRMEGRVLAGKDVFLSVGGTANEEQERFVSALEERLRAEGLIPNTVGRNTFSSDAPLKTVERLMDTCVGTIVVALERSYFPKGKERRGGHQEKELAETRLATPWNQIEAAMSYSRGLPLFVLVQKGLKTEGLLETGYDWYVQTVTLDIAALGTKEFNGVLASWKDKLQERPFAKQQAISPAISVEDLTLGEIFKALKPAQLWSILAAAAIVVGGAFALGAKLLP